MRYNWSYGCPKQGLIHMMCVIRLGTSMNMAIFSPPAGTLCSLFVSVSSVVIHGRIISRGLQTGFRGFNQGCWLLASRFPKPGITCSAFANPSFSNLTVSSVSLLDRPPRGEYERLMPCPPQNYPPRIEHIIVEKGGNVVDIISDSLGLPRLYVEDLISFGAVHYSLVCPVPPLTATPEQMELFNKYTAPDMISTRMSLRKKTLQEARKVLRIFTSVEELEVGCYLRVHVHPKRCSRCYEVDWHSRVLVEADEFVVLDKPAGVSVGGTVDNLEESCATFAARALGLAKPLILTHQIDTCTEGCVVLAKTADFASKFHELLRVALKSVEATKKPLDVFDAPSIPDLTPTEQGSMMMTQHDRKVKKQYCALTAAAVPLGKVTSFMRPGRRTPRVFAQFPFPDWAKCELEVLKCKKVPWPKSSTEERYRVGPCAWTRRDHAYEVTVRLLTGRTHQIRGQFAALGAPLVGDSMYMPAAAARLASQSVDPFFKGSEYVPVDDLATEEWMSLHGPEPEFAIGLQASYVSWGGKGCTSKAGVPWWQT